MINECNLKNQNRRKINMDVFLYLTTFYIYIYKLHYNTNNTHGNTNM